VGTTPASDTIQYLNPTSPALKHELYVPAVGALHGKWVAFVTNGWASFGKIGRHMEQLLKAGHGIAGMRIYAVPTSPGPGPQALDRIARECDAAVVGLAN